MSGQETSETGAGAASDTLVEFINVQKSFDGETLVIKDLNLEIRRGEFLTLLGPSGSGKTTTLLMLAGFEVPTHGDIRLANVTIGNLPPHKRDIGMVFQNYALFPHMTVYENLAFPLTTRRLPKEEIKDRVRRALEMVQLPGYENRRPNQLSGGQQQRIACARALVYEPKIVLMDEPLGALDKQLREQMQLEIKHIHESLGVTIVYVTHDQSEALVMSDRIAVFNDGEIQQLDAPETLYEKPQNSFVAQFIGENNRLHGRVVELRDGHCRVELDNGDTVRAVAVNVDEVGSRTTVSIRPENLAVNPKNGTLPNSYQARIEEVIYLGDHTRVRMNLCGNDDFTVKVPRNEGVIDQFQIGENVTVGWRAEDSRALDPFEQTQPIAEA